MLITAAGSVKPAKMIALGAGVAGLQAIATARRLGAVVHGFDVREAAREQVESLGARFVSPGEALKAQESANGYAADQSADEQAGLRRALGPTLAQMQHIVTSAPQSAGGQRHGLCRNESRDRIKAARTPARAYAFRQSTRIARWSMPAG
jgi:NAD/NADP transhydrogenase alpha subunit